MVSANAPDKFRPGQYSSSIMSNSTRKVNSSRERSDSRRHQRIAVIDESRGVKGNQHSRTPRLPPDSPARQCKPATAGRTPPARFAPTIAARENKPPGRAREIPPPVRRRSAFSRGISQAVQRQPPPDQAAEIMERRIPPRSRRVEWRRFVGYEFAAHTIGNFGQCRWSIRYCTCSSGS